MVASVETLEVVVDGVVIGHTKKATMWDKNAALEKATKFHGRYENDNNQRVLVKIIDLTGRV